MFDDAYLDDSQSTLVKLGSLSDSLVGSAHTYAPTIYADAEISSAGTLELAYYR